MRYTAMSAGADWLQARKGGYVTTILRPNRAKHKLEAGEAVLAPALGANSLPDLDTLEELGSLGVIDVAWVEMEHGPWTWRDLSDISRVCDLCGISSLVRVNRNDPAVIGRTLDRGIQSIVVPHISTKKQAERVIEGALYAPQGLRGVAASRQGYGVADYLQKANKEIMVVILLEDVEAIRNLEQILTVDNIDCFYVAPSDLAQSMGARYLGQPYHPDVQAVVRNAVETIVAARRSAGAMVSDENVEEWLSLGARFLRFSALPYLQEGLKRFHQKVAMVTKALGG
jgi:4-hydroxy-2-oxoheptanedioate aldolase